MNCPSPIRSSYSLICLAGLAVMVFASAALGTWAANQFSQTTDSPIRLLADTAAKGKSLSLATGLVSPEVEGLYILDHASGLLQCWIMNPRTGAVGGIFQTNVIAEFGAEKIGAGDYTMVTGGFAFTGGVTGNMGPANSIVYVADEATGNIVGYSFSFNRTMLNRGVMQQGALNAVCKGPTRGASVERDQ